MKLKMGAAFFIFLLTLSAGAQIVPEFKVNGQKTDPNTFKLAVGDRITISCVAQDQKTYVKAIAPRPTDDSFLSKRNGTTWTQNQASFKTEIEQNDGREKGCLTMGCQSSQNERIIDDGQSFCVKTVKEKETNSNPSRVENMNVLVNGHAVDPETYELKKGDAIKVTCTAKDNDSYLKFFSPRSSFASMGDGTRWLKKQILVFDRDVSSDDGKDEDCLILSCRASRNEKIIDDEKSVCLKTVRKKDRNANPSKLRGMIVEVTAKDSPEKPAAPRPADAVKK